MRLARILLAAACALGAPACAVPADFPAREVTLVVPNEPGGGIDLVARILAPRLAAALGQQVIVVNRSGASGTIGTLSVAKAEPDGHTVLVTGVGHLVAPMLQANASYDPLGEFEPLARIADAPTVLVAHESLRELALAQILSDPRSKDARFAYGSAGYGHSSHLAAEVLMSRSGARWLHVPYRGTGPATRALAAGEVQLMLMPAGSVKGAVAGGRAHAVAVAHPRRLASLPGVPTFAESGMRGAEFAQWYAVFAPRGSPAPALERLDGAFRAARGDPAVLERLQALGLEPAAGGKAEFAAFLSREAARLRELVQRLPLERPGSAPASAR